METLAVQHSEEDRGKGQGSEQYVIVRELVVRSRWRKDLSSLPDRKFDTI
jgi:hypothetical protein